MRTLALGLVLLHGSPVLECADDAEPAIRALAAATAAAADLPNTPSPSVFASAWAKRFEEAVTRAAGRDGRLSWSEAKRIAEREGWESLFSDDAVAVLGSTGQKTISVARIVALARARALASATAAAGNDGRLSLDDGKKLSKSLRDDFRWLRGKLALDPARTDAELARDVRVEAERALLFANATKLSRPPSSVMGRKPVIERIDHPASGTWAEVWVADGQIYLSRASSTPSPLVGWWHVGPVPTAELAAARAKVAEEIGSRAEGLWVVSERDAKVLYVNAGPIDAGAGLGPDTIASRFAAAHDELTTNIYDTQNFEVAPLAGRTVEEVGADVFFDALANGDEGEKFEALRDAIEANLDDVHVYRFVGGAAVSIFVVGKTASGDLAGVLTAKIET